LHDERDLIERAKKDPEAFGVFFERHYDAIFGYVLRRVGDWDLAKDVTSEVFLRALTNLWRFRWQGIPLSAWLYRIATNEINMVFRKGRRRALSLDALIEESGFDPIDPKTVEAEKREAELKLREYDDFMRIRGKLAELSAPYQEVIALRYFERKSLKQIAEILGKKEGTLKSLLSRGLDRLRERLE